MSKQQQQSPKPPRNNNWLRRRVTLHTPADAVGAKQSFKTECDINFIMQKYQKTGAITHFNTRQPQYGYAAAVDFREALDIVKTGTEVFNALPSSLRTKFENDPALFLEFVQNPANADEMVALGLREPQTASEAEAATPPAPQAGSPA